MADYSGIHRELSEERNSHIILLFIIVLIISMIGCSKPDATISIADDLLEKAKKRARREKKTLREVVEEALRLRLSQERSSRPFRLKRHPFKGKGLQPGIAEGDWEQVRNLIYRMG